MNTAARHGRLPRRSAVKPLLAIVAGVLGVVLASTASVAAIAAWMYTAVILALVVPAALRRHRRRITD